MQFKFLYLLLCLPGLCFGMEKTVENAGYSLINREVGAGYSSRIPAIIQAIDCGDLEGVRKILDAQPDQINSRIFSSSGYTITVSETPLHRALDNLGLVKLLMERGADPFALNRNDRTPLLIAVSCAMIGPSLEEFEQIKILMNGTQKRSAQLGVNFQRLCMNFLLYHKDKFNNDLEGVWREGLKWNYCKYSQEQKLTISDIANFLNQFYVVYNPPLLK